MEIKKEVIDEIIEITKYLSDTLGEKLEHLINVGAAKEENPKEKANIPLLCISIFLGCNSVLMSSALLEQGNKDCSPLDVFNHIIKITRDFISKNENIHGTMQ